MPPKKTKNKKIEYAYETPLEKSIMGLGLASKIKKSKQNKKNYEATKKRRKLDQEFDKLWRKKNQIKQAKWRNKIVIDPSTGVITTNQVLAENKKKIRRGEASSRATQNNVSSFNSTHNQTKHSQPLVSDNSLSAPQTTTIPQQQTPSLKFPPVLLRIPNPPPPLVSALGVFGPSKLTLPSIEKMLEDHPDLNQILPSGNN